MFWGVTLIAYTFFIGFLKIHHLMQQFVSLLQFLVSENKVNISHASSLTCSENLTFIDNK